MTASAVAYGNPVPSDSGQQKSVAFLGDSITDGVITDPAIPHWIPNKKKLCWNDFCFYALVEAALESLNVHAANQGYGGATSRDWDPNDFLENDIHAKFVKGSLLDNLPTANVVVIYLGTNDAVAFFENAPPTSADDYEAHLVDIIKTLRHRGVKSFVAVTPPIPTGWVNTFQGNLMAEYADRVRDTAMRTPRVHLADVESVFPASGWEYPAIHPNIEGHAFISEVVLEAVLRALDYPRPVDRNLKLRFGQRAE